MKATDFKYLHYMTLKEWKQFVKNYDPEYFGTEGMDIKTYINSANNYSFMCFIMNAFQWNKSPQDWDYWDNISYRTKPVK